MKNRFQPLLGSHLVNLIEDQSGNFSITSDGISLIHELHFRTKNPIEKVILKTGEVQGKLHGDLSKSSILFTTSLILEGLELINTGFHPSLIKEGFSIATIMSSNWLMERRAAPTSTFDGTKEFLFNNLVQKLSKPASRHFSTLISPVVSKYMEKLNLSGTTQLEGAIQEFFRGFSIHLKPGGRILDSRLVAGVIINKTPVFFNHDFSMNSSSGGLRHHLAFISGELYVDKKKHEDFTIEISSPVEFAHFQENIGNVYKSMSKRIESLGINVLITERGIDEELISDLRLHDPPVLIFRRVKKEEMVAVARYTGGKIVHNVKHLEEKDIGGIDNISCITIRKEPAFLFTKVNSQGNGTGCQSLLISGSMYEICESVKSFVIDAIRSCFYRKLGVVNEFPRILGTLARDLPRDMYKYNSARMIKSKLFPVIEIFARGIKTIPDTLIMNGGGDIFSQNPDAVKSFTMPAITVLKMIDSASSTAGHLLSVDNVFEKRGGRGREHQS
ncbi:MAG: TCP-1/cpn60 chaperonin family protein [Promethearchaeota archaeon]